MSWTKTIRFSYVLQGDLKFDSAEVNLYSFYLDIYIYVYVYMQILLVKPLNMISEASMMYTPWRLT